MMYAYVSFAGIDHTVRVRDLNAFVKEYPRAVFTFMMKDIDMSDPGSGFLRLRYPSVPTIMSMREELRSVAPDPASGFHGHWAMRLKGPIARWAVGHPLNGAEQVLFPLLRCFGPIDVAASPLDIESEAVAAHTLNTIRKNGNGFSVLNIQARTHEDMPLARRLGDGVLLTPEVGQTVTPERRPRLVDGVQTGYFGGIGPSNISSVMSAIEQANHGIKVTRRVAPFIAVELGARDPATDHFSLDRCAKIYEQMVHKLLPRSQD